MTITSCNCRRHNAGAWLHSFPTSMNNLRVSTDIGTEGDNCMELLGSGAVQADHIVYQSNLQECCELHTKGRTAVKHKHIEHTSSMRKSGRIGVCALPYGLAAVASQVPPEPRL